MKLKKKLMYGLMMGICFLGSIGISNKASAKTFSNVNKTTLEGGILFVPVSDDALKYNSETNELTCSAFKDLSLGNNNQQIYVSFKNNILTIYSNNSTGSLNGIKWSHIWYGIETKYGVDVINNTKKIVFKNVYLSNTKMYGEEDQSYILDARLSGVYYGDDVPWEKLDEIDLGSAKLTSDCTRFPNLTTTEYYGSEGSSVPREAKIIKTITLPSVYSDDIKIENYSYLLSGVEKVYNLENLPISESMSYLFAHSKLTKIDLSKFDTSKVTNMRGLFYGCSELQSVNFQYFNTSNVIDMSYMFAGCYTLTSLDLENYFDTSNVTNMSGMFCDCYNLETIDISAFDTSKVTNMRYMFQSSSKLKKIDISSFDFSNVKYMSSMFEYTEENPTEVKINPTCSIQCEELYRMFKESNISNIQEILNCINFNSVNNCKEMFYKAKLPETLALKGNLSNLDTSCMHMFFQCEGLKTLDLSKLDFTDINEVEVQDILAGSTKSQKVPITVGLFDGVDKSVDIITPNSVFKLPVSAQIHSSWLKNYLVEGEIVKSDTYTKKSTVIKVLPEKYTITFNLYEGTNANGKIPSSTTVYIGNKYEIDSSWRPTKDHYTFVGWKINNTGDLVTEVPANNWEDITLDVIYEVNKYNITYNGVDGATNPNPAQYEYGTEVVLKDATKEGYDFEGWYEDEKFTIPVLKISNTSDKARTFYAKFEDNHTKTTTVGAKEPTCEEDGCTGTTTCDICGKVVSENSVIPKTGHQEENRGAVTASCGKDGYTGDTYCKTCNKKLADGEVIPATDNHTWNEGVVTKEATETSTGVRTYTCTVCGTTKEEVIPVITPEDDHTKTEVRGKVEATCTKEGYTGDTYCSVCGKKLATGVKTDKKEHSFVVSITKESTTDAEGEKTHTCTVCGFTKTEKIDKLTKEETQTHENAVKLEEIKDNTIIKPNTEIAVPTSGVKVNGLDVNTTSGFITFDTEGTYKISVGDKVYTFVVKVESSEPKKDDKTDEKKDDKKDEKTSEEKKETTTEVKQDTPHTPVHPNQTTTTTGTEPTTAVTSLSDVKGLKAKTKKKKTTLSWKKVTNAKGYQLQVAKNKKMKKGVKKYNVKGTKKVLKLKKGTYFVRVRAVSDNVNSKWSKTKKIKVK